MTSMELAAKVIDYMTECDPYGIATDISDRDEATKSLTHDLGQCAAWLEEQAEEYDDDRARELLTLVRAS